jgi:hypothetical protein
MRSVEIDVGGVGKLGERQAGMGRDESIENKGRRGVGEGADNLLEDSHI